MQQMEQTGPRRRHLDRRGRGPFDSPGDDVGWKDGKKALRSVTVSMMTEKGGK